MNFIRSREERVRRREREERRHEAREKERERKREQKGRKSAMKVKVSASLAVVDAQTPAPSDPRIRWLEQDSFMRQQQRQREREGALQVSACLRDLALKRRERERTQFQRLVPRESGG